MKNMIRIVPALLFLWCLIAVFSQKSINKKTADLPPFDTRNKEKAIRTVSCDSGKNAMKNPIDFDEHDPIYGWMDDEINYAWDSCFTIHFVNEKMHDQYENQINFGKVEMIYPLLRI